MVRLFKHYVPYAALLLGPIGAALLLGAGELAWSIRALQIDVDPGALADRAFMLSAFAVTPEGAR